MRRLASLYLPDLAIERLLRAERREAGRGVNSSPERGGGPHEVRWRGASAASCGDVGPLHQPAAGPPPRSGEEQADDPSHLAHCSCPNTPGWRPGARWARAEVEAQIEALPLHQRPNMRELGRRSEAADVAYRKSSPAFAGEGDHPQGGGGARAKRASSLPDEETALRAAPPPAFGWSPSPGNPGEDLPPIVTAIRTGNRQLLAAVSPSARALGLAPGMPLTQARALVPGLDIRDADPEADAALLESLALFAARRWTPRAAISAPDGLFLDLTGVSHLLGGEKASCLHFVHFCARLGFTARIAVAGTYGAAHALAHFSGKAVSLCPNGAEAQAIAPMPLAALRIGEEALSAARRLGIERVGELVAMPRAPLQRRFGKTLLERLDQAIGRVSEAVDPVVPQEAPDALLRFAEPIASPEAIAAALGRLMTDLAATLAKRALGARAVRLICLRVDKEEQEIAIGTARATRDASHLLRLMLPKVEEIEPGFGIDAMRLVAMRVEPLTAQIIEGALAGEKPAPDLSFLIDRLAGRLGARRLFRVGAVESDVPERSVRRVSPLARPQCWPKWPRPVRLLSPPERVDNVIALLPDLPPRRFTWRGRAYRVRAADGPERIHGEWWRARAEADAVRDYFQIEDEEGARFWLFRRGDGVDAATGDLSWYLHGVFG